MEADELFKEHLDDLLKMTDAGGDFKDEQRRLWKLKEKVEPVCINDPTTGDLITNKEEIKSKSLAHCVKILSKNPIRECDREELKRKEKNKRMFKLFNNAGDKQQKGHLPIHEQDNTR